jgi:hypothetical protein
MNDRALSFLRAMYESLAGGTPEQKQQLATALSLWVSPLARNFTEAFEAGAASCTPQPTTPTVDPTPSEPAPATAKARRKS